MRADNKHILEVIKNNRENGIKMLFDSYYRPLVLFANEIVGDVGQAEDLVQDLFIKLWQDDYLLKISHSALQSYLYTSVKNGCKSKLIKRDILNESNNLNGYDKPIEEVYTISEEEIGRVSSALKALPKQTRSVIEAVVIGEFKYKEAAEELNISVNTVKTLLQRGIKALREKIS